MKIGYDGKRATKNLTGLGNYSRWLIESISNIYPNHEYLVYTKAINESPRVKNFIASENIKIKTPVYNKFLWRRMGIIKDLIKDRINIYHGLSNEIPFGIQHSKIKTVVTIHDLMFLNYPKHYGWFDAKLYNWKSKSSCEAANKIIAISENTKNDIIKFYNINPDKIEVIYQSCHDQFKIALNNEELKNIKINYNLPDKYILYVGTIESRKNLAAVVNALSKVDNNLNLVVVGKKKKYFYSIIEPLIKKLNLDSRILFFENLNFNDLPGFYQNAEVFVLPSFYEGFGIPIIEALYSNIPVITSSGSCLEEAGGPDSKYVDPNDVDGIVLNINLITHNKEIRENMIQKGRLFVEKFNTPNLCKQLMDCYNSIID